jgi:hypothetical protein
MRALIIVVPKRLHDSVRIEFTHVHAQRFLKPSSDYFPLHYYFPLHCGSRSDSVRFMPIRAHAQ